LRIQGIGHGVSSPCICIGRGLLLLDGCRRGAAAEEASDGVAD
jgi:hypothetical protein